MTQFLVDPQLVEMLRARRVIPFIGAGFSADLPNWEALLSKVSAEIEGALPYKTVADCCSNDMLQIAEYYLLMADGNIGPLRYAIEHALAQDKNPVLSGPHVELVNLGTPHIYTTNFDDLIEMTFRELGLPVEIVSLPKDVAMSSEGKTQIIKYHGDLRHESTLVLTESSYYSRLDFESPMDLKFRSDLLGRSVLFMGYSFRDINIRIIWFKLMEMMKDIPSEDRPTSFIVRLGRNPVLEKLYESVGINTIVLDPHNKAKSNEAKTRLLSDFMFELSLQVSPDGKIPGSREQQFVSLALLDAIRDQSTEARVSKRYQYRDESRLARRRLIPSRLDALERLLAVLQKRRIPSQLGEACRTLLDDLVLKTVLRISRIPRLSVLPFAKRYTRQFGPTPSLTLLVSIGLAEPRPRKVILSEDIPWKNVWASQLSQEQANVILQRYQVILKGPEFAFDYSEWVKHQENIAYLTDPVLRIAQGQIVDKSDKKTISLARKLLQKAYTQFPPLKNYRPGLERKPLVGNIARKMVKLARKRRI